MKSQQRKENINKNQVEFLELKSTAVTEIKTSVIELESRTERADERSAHLSTSITS